MNTYRHGDLAFEPVKEIKGSEVKFNNSFVLAYGEHSGHKHVITKVRGELKIFKDSSGQYCIDVEDEAKITHEEHKTITIKKGIYKINNEREYDYFSLEINKVID